jgi:hypothetical protein
MSEMIAEKDAAALKTRGHRVPATPLPPGQHWYYFNFATVQSAGEVSATARNDGTVGMLTIYPPTHPLQSPQRWFFQHFSSPNSAVSFLNEPPVQSDGEVSSTARNDGTVGMFYIAPA